MGVTETCISTGAGNLVVTDIGLFPIDWEVSSLQHRWSVKDCKHITAVFVAEGYPVASIREVQYRFVELGEANRTTRHFFELLTEGGRSPRVGDLILSRNATVGEVAQVAEFHPAFAMGQDVCLLRRKSSSESPTFLQEIIRSGIVRKQLSDLMVGSTFKRANVQQIKNLLVPFPAESEQQAIAEALSDADALIESLSLLLAKKRQIKQGSMQELLAGKERLPGFSGEWSEKSLGELFHFSGGLSASRDQLSTSGHLYLHYGDIHTSARCFIDVALECGSISRLDIGLRKIPPTALLSDGDVVFVDASEDDDGVSKHVVVVNREGVPFIAGLHTIVAKQKREELSSVYLRYCFQTQAVKEQFKFYAVGTKVSGISKKNIAKITLPVPARAEQSAIGEVLVSIDEDIDTLELKLTKARQLKQGMMQALLTGRIRLVQPASSVVKLPIKPALAKSLPERSHNWQINEAVVISVLAQRFGTEEFPLPRKRRVKLMYLLHRHSEGRADGYLKKVAGPYDPNTKYKGPEVIALKNGYVRALNNGKYEGFVAGDKAGQAFGYFDQWYGAAVLEWLERFHYRKTDDLELLATVDMAMVDLGTACQPADVAGVKRVIAAHPEWVPKLSRELFSDEKIARAISECQSLFDN